MWSNLIWLYITAPGLCVHKLSCMFQPEATIFTGREWHPQIHCSLYSSILWQLSASPLCCSSLEVCGVNLQWLQT